MRSCDYFTGNFWIINPIFGAVKQQFGGHIFHNTAEMGMDVREWGECGGPTCIMTDFLNTWQEGENISVC
jgi:hypothetical protein